MRPTARQAEFLSLDCEEVLYGGAAGGAKTEALLMWLADGVSLPDYSGIIFRRTYPQLAKSNEGLIAKSHRMYRPIGGEWNGTTHTWRFPSGAVIELGHLPYEKSIDDYTGPSYHRVAYDELTQFSENQYLFIAKSRIRKPPVYPIRCGARAATNPGGSGHQWVKQRFIPPEALASLRGLTWRDPSPPGMIFHTAPDRAFVPARLADNPYLDLEDYVSRLMHLAPVTRERVLNGDWSISEEGLIKPEWLRYFTTKGDFIELRDKHDQIFARFEQSRILSSRFATADTAGTSADKVKEKKGKAPSWSVIAVWDVAPTTIGPFLLLRHVWRKRVDFTALLEGFRAVYREWRPRKLKVEDKHFGPAARDVLRREMPIDTIGTGSKDKVERATDLLNKLDRGEVFLPKYDNDWLPDLEAEWLGWTGLEDETADQVDVASYAAMQSPSLMVWGGVIR